MKKNQCLTVILALVMMLSCFGVNVSAAEECLGAEETISVVRATGKFDMEVRANRTVKAGSSFPLEVGEVVTIKATYSPYPPVFTMAPLSTNDMLFSCPLR